jgi:hypothetical protein
VDQTLNLIVRRVPETAALRFPGNFRGGVASLVVASRAFAAVSFAKATPQRLTSSFERAPLDLVMSGKRTLYSAILRAQESLTPIGPD